MGDLTQTEVQGHQDLFQDEQILERVGRLGETKTKDGVPQFSVHTNDNSVIELSAIWSSFRGHLDSNRIRNEPKVLETLLRYTAWIIFDGRFTQKVAPSTKSQLVETFRSVGSIKDTSSSSLGRICASLVPLSESPWTESVFRAATSEESPKEAGDELWTREGRVLLETRVETLGRMKRLPTIDVIARILRICADKGNVWESDVHVTSSEDLRQFDAFAYRNLEEYCDLLETAVLFWKHTDIHFLATLPVHVILKTLRRLTSPRATPPRLLPRLWAKEDPRQLARQFTNSFLPALLRRKVDADSLTAFFDFWVDVNVESSTSPEERLSEVKSLVDQESFEPLFSTDCLYSLASFLRRKFGPNKTTRELFASLFVRALVVDINCIEKSRTEIPLDPQKVRNSCEALATRILQLSQFFDGFPETSRNLLLTSFSLKPSQDLFDQLFPPTEAPLPPSPPEDLDLPEDLCNDLFTVIFKPRWAALGRQIKGDELKKNCEQLLQKDFSWLSTGRQNAELKYVNVNYDDYKHLPSKYDPNDDGIEKGFTLSGKRKKKQLLRKQRETPKPLPKTNPLKPIKTSKPVSKKLPRKNWGSSRVPQTLKTPKKPPKFTPESPKLPVKPGRKPKQPEVVDKLSTITQYLRQTETITKFLEATESGFPKSSLTSKAKKLKEQYKLAFCSEEKSIPGHSTILPYPNAYKNRGRSTFVEISRPKPTAYIASPTPFHLKLQGVGNFDLEFRLSKTHLGNRILDTKKPRFKKAQYGKQQRREEFSPAQTSYARWSICAQDFGESITSSEDKATETLEATETEKQMVPKVNKLCDLENCPLKQLTRDYRTLKEKYNDLSNEPEEDFDLSCPTALEYIVPFPSESTESTSIESTESTKLRRLHIGDMIEFRTQRRVIRLPPGPKHLQEAVKLRIMIDDAVQRLQKNLTHETFKYPALHADSSQGPSNKQSKTRNTKRKTAADSSAGDDKQDAPHVNGEVSISSRGRRRKLLSLDFSSGVDQLEDEEEEEEKPRKPRRTSAVTKRSSGKEKPVDSSNEKSSRNTLPLPVPDPAPLLIPSYIVPKGVSPFETILRTVTPEEFSEALGNLSLEPLPPLTQSPVKANFGDDFALRVWALYNQNKNLTQIQSQLKCSWGPVNRRVNDSAYVKRVFTLLQTHSPSFAARLLLQTPQQQAEVSPEVTDPPQSIEPKVPSPLKEPPKPKFLILFPMLQNASIRKAGELVARKPLDIPKAPVTLRRILDEMTGAFVEVPSTAEEEDPNVLAALAVPWPEEEEGGEGDQGDDEHIRRLEAEHWKLLDEEPAYNEVEILDYPPPLYLNNTTKKEAVPNPPSPVPSLPPEEPDSLPGVSKAPKEAPRKRRRAESPEEDSDSSSSRHSFSSVEIWSSEESLQEKPKPRSRRVVRRRIVEGTRREEEDPSSPEESSEAERVRLTELCVRKQVRVILDFIPQEQLLKYNAKGDAGAPSSPEGKEEGSPQQEESREVSEPKELSLEEELEEFENKEPVEIPEAPPLPVEDALEPPDVQLPEPEVQFVLPEDSSDLDVPGSPVNSTASESPVESPPQTSHVKETTQEELPQSEEVVDPSSPSVPDLQVDDPSSEPTPLKRSTRIRLKDTQLCFKKGVIQKIPTEKTPPAPKRRPKAPVPPDNPHQPHPQSMRTRSVALETVRSASRTIQAIASKITANNRKRTQSEGRATRSGAKRLKGPPNEDSSSSDSQSEDSSSPEEAHLSPPSTRSVSTRTASRSVANGNGVINPIQVNVSRKKKVASLPSLNNSATAQDPLASSPTLPIKRVIDEIELSSDSEAEVVEVSTDEVNNHNEESQGDSPLVEMYIIDDDDSTQEDFGPTDDYTMDEDFVDRRDLLSPQVDQDESTSVVCSPGETASPEMILGLDEDSVGYTDVDGDENFVEIQINEECFVDQQLSNKFDTEEEQTPPSTNCDEVCEETVPLEPTPPLLTPENNVSTHFVDIVEDDDNNGVLNEPKSPPTLLKFDDLGDPPKQHRQSHT